MTRWLLLAGFLLAAHPAHGQGTRQWRPEERVVISDFSVVRAVAAGQTKVFVASLNGLGIYDWRMRRWEAPVSFADGFPHERVNAALADPTDESVWLATDAGLVRYRPLFRQFESTLVAGGVRALLYDRDDPYRGIFVRTVRGWEFLARGSFLPAPGPPPPPAGRRGGSLSVAALLARQPIADAMRAATLIDERLRSYRYTGAAAVPLTEEYYIGTDGRGVIRLEGLAGRFEPLPFGLLGPGAGAVVAVPGGVWVGTDHRSPRSGLTFVSDDLQGYTVREGPRATGLGITGIRALIARRDQIWAATDRGVVRFGPGDETRVLLRGDGLPDEDVFALAQGPSGVWVGTAFGLALVTDDDEVHPVGAVGPLPVLALAAVRDTAWVGTTDGLGMATPGGELLVPPDVAEVPDLKTAIVGVVRVADTLVAASVERLLWRAPGGDWQIERIIAGELGAIYVLAADSGGVWVGGERGIGFFRFATRDYRFYYAPGDVPGPVRGLAVSGAHLWVATEAGVARFARHALVP